tara:strand:+ start:131 stop:382 length:252 start_codon:yes stop_codon:yes gene_type:complete
MNCKVTNLKKDNTYTQCIWNANGELSCNPIKVVVDKNNNYKNYIQFDNFSTPNNNYKPNYYHQNKQWYNSNAQNDCLCNWKKK